MPSVLFVCTGNRIRSPLAAAFFCKALLAAGMTGWTVGSAGTWTDTGQPADPRAVKEGARLGLDLKEHRSRLVRASLLAESDLVLVMASDHKEALQVEFPQYEGKVHLLLKVVDGVPYDVPDPLNASPRHFREMVDEMGELITRGFKKICALAEGKQNA
jgi:protein-tyrosine phosphatase